MNRSLSILLVTLFVVPTVLAQDAIGLDVRVDRVFLAIEPIVNTTGEVRAYLSSNAPARITITYAWGDGAPLSGEDSAANADSSVVTVMREAGAYEYRFPFKPSAARRGPQEIVVSVQTESDTNRTNDEIRTSVFVRDPRLNVTFETPARTDVVGEEWVPIRYFITNHGNALERPTAAFAVDAPWQVAEYGPLPEIPPGASVAGVVLVRGDPANATALSLRVTIRSSIHIAMTVARMAPPLVANATVLPERAVRIDALSPSLQVVPGENVRLPFTVHNAGEVDDIINVTVAPVLGWDLRIEPGDGWVMNASRPAVDRTQAVVLKPGGSARLALNVTRGENATTHEVTLTAASRSAALYAAKLDARHTASATVRLVVAGPDLAVEAPRLPSVIYQGDVPSVEWGVRNVGREPSRNATLNIALRDNVRTAAEGIYNVPPLAPGAVHRISWNFSTRGLAGEFSLNARLAPNVTGTPDRDIANDIASARLHVRVPTLRALAPDALIAVPGEQLLVRASAGGFSIENQGDRSETIDVRLSGPDWAEAAWRVDVAARAAQVIPLALDIPASPGGQHFELTLTAQVANRSQFLATARTTLRIDDVDVPAITPLSLGTGEVGTPIQLRARVIDAFGIEHARAIVTAPDGTRVSVALEPGREDVHAGEYVPRMAGSHRIEYRATDASDRARSALVENATLDVRPRPYAGMTLVGLTDGAAIGARVLQLREVVEGTTRLVLIDDGAGPTTLEPPYALELPWKEGSHRLKVRAESHDGAVMERTWNLTLDLTPPALSEPTIERRADGKLQLRIQAPQAKNVTARFDTANAPVSVELDARSGGTFASIVTPPESWTRVAFIATDAAGNTASAVVDARAADTPLGWAVALVAIMLAASWRRFTRGRG